jgi:hypothetical protein
MGACPGEQAMKSNSDANSVKQRYTKKGALSSSVKVMGFDARPDING